MKKQNQEHSSKMLVTGGCGFIGSNLTQKLLEEGHRVTIVDNLSSARDDFDEFIKQNDDVELVPLCFASDYILDRIKNKEFDIVFHNAAIPRVSFSVENPHLTTEANVTKTVKLMESCVGNIDRFVFASSSSVYGGADILPTPNSHPKDPKSPYAWQKSSVEDIIKIFCNLYEFDAVCLRYFNVFGPGQFGGSAYATAISAWCNAIKNNLPLRSDGTGEQTRDMCYVDNVVQANLKAAFSDSSFSGECVNVACGDRVSNNDILAFLKSRFENIEVKNAPSRPGDVMHTQADISKTQDLIGYEPEVKFWDGLEKTLAWWGLC